MKGQSELTQTFIKLVQIALVVVGALAIFFTYISYEITVYRNDANREVYILGNALMSSSCLTDGIKGLLTQSKIDSMVADSSCFKYPIGKVTISSTFYTPAVTIDLGSADIEEEAEFDILIRLNSGQIEPGEMVVTI